MRNLTQRSVVMPLETGSRSRGQGCAKSVHCCQLTLMLIFMSHNSLEFTRASFPFQKLHSHTNPKEANIESKSPVPTEPSPSTSLGQVEAHAS